MGPYAQLACIPEKTDLPYESQYLAYNTSGITLGYDQYFSFDDGFFYGVMLADFDLNIFNIENCSGLYPHTDDLTQIFCSGCSFTIILVAFFILLITK